MRKQLGLAADHRLLFGVSFGYEDPDVKANAARVGGRHCKTSCASIAEQVMNNDMAREAAEG